MISEAENATEQVSHKVATNNPLEQFVLLAKGCRGAGCLELIKQVLETPGVHVFGEFLHMPQIAEVQLSLPPRVKVYFIYFPSSLPHGASTVQRRDTRQILQHTEPVRLWNVQGVRGE